MQVSPQSAVKRACRAGRPRTRSWRGSIRWSTTSIPATSLDDVAAAWQAAAPGGQTGERIKGLADKVRQTPNLCLPLDNSTVIEMASGRDEFGPSTGRATGLYVVDLVYLISAAERGTTTRRHRDLGLATGQVAGQTRADAPYSRRGRELCPGARPAG